MKSRCTDSAARAVRSKPKSSMAVGLAAVQDRRGGCVHVCRAQRRGHGRAHLAIIGRVPGVARPALVTVLPTLKGRSMLLDLGAVTDPKPRYPGPVRNHGHDLRYPCPGPAEPEGRTAFQRRGAVEGQPAGAGGLSAPRGDTRESISSEMPRARNSSRATSRSSSPMASPETSR